MAPGVRKVSSIKVAGAEPCGQIRDGKQGWGKVVSVKGEQQGEVGMQPRSHTVFWSCCKSQTVASHKPRQSVDVEETVDQNNERN